MKRNKFIDWLLVLGIITFMILLVCVSALYIIALIHPSVPVYAKIFLIIAGLSGLAVKLLEKNR